MHVSIFTQKVYTKHKMVYISTVLGAPSTEEDKLVFQAIGSIHKHLDDDRSGNVDFNESIEVSEMKSMGKLSSSFT